jgi:Uma2 family endonuclease
MYLQGPADLAIELVSPDSRKRDRVEKFREYEAGGVREYWVIDAARRKAEFFHLGEDRHYHPINIGADGIFHSQVLSGLWLRVDWLWETPLPRSFRVMQELGII